MNYLDLFSGIGGFALGAYWAGWRFDRHYFSEIDPWCCKLYQQRFPDAVPLGDIREIDGSTLPDGEWIITGGFPCQDISPSSPTKTGIDGERSGLWKEYSRLIGELRPRFAIVENSGELPVRGLADVLADLSSQGYDAEWEPISASDVGAPHKRTRTFILAYPPGGGFQGQGLPSRERSKESESPALRNWPPRPSAISDVPRRIDGLSNRVDRLRGLGNAIVPQIAEMILREIARWAQPPAESPAPDPPQGEAADPDMNADGPAERAHRQDEARRMK